MNALRVLLVMLATLPARDDRDTVFRYYLAEAIVAATDDVVEQNTLAKIARWESGYRRDVAACRVNGDHGGAFGSFQVHPRSPQERKAICASLEGSARAALVRIRESIAACGDLTGFVAGKCGVAVSAAKARWGGE